MTGGSTSLSAVQLDALREVANIGAGHAATALSQMTGHSIMINVPALAVKERSGIAELLESPDGDVAVVDVHMVGDLTGQTLLVFTHEAAKRLSGLLTGRATVEGELNVLERSAIQEVGN
ncbi:MAG: chemotaxis protein CheC, partial [Gemmatimonadetes bacterium]|nr:chemotaxis protein CheC [Gemmatimonadota bacterium]